MSASAAPAPATVPSRERPPMVIGAREAPGLTGGAQRPAYWCGVHAPANEFPFMTEPVWRGEAPAQARCETCAIELSDLQ